MRRRRYRRRIIRPHRQLKSARTVQKYSLIRKLQYMAVFLAAATFILDTLWKAYIEYKDIKDDTANRAIQRLQMSVTLQKDMIQSTSLAYSILRDKQSNPHQIRSALQLLLRKGLSVYNLDLSCNPSENIESSKSCQFNEKYHSMNFNLDYGDKYHVEEVLEDILGNYPAFLDSLEYRLYEEATEEEFLEFLSPNTKSILFSDFSNQSIAHLEGSGTSFYHTNFLNANLNGSSLVYSEFHNCNLAGSTFKNADLSKSIFTNVVLVDANFDGAKINNIEIKELAPGTSTETFINAWAHPDHLPKFPKQGFKYLVCETKDNCVIATSN